LEILSTSWIVPVEGPPLERGQVAVDDGTIVWVGEATSPKAPSGTLRDLGPGILLPGLVNAHCHLELSHLRGRVDSTRGFTAWVEELVRIRGEETEAIRRATLEAIRSLESTGTVAVGDVSNTLVHLDLLAESSLSAVVFYELLGWDPKEATRILEAAEARLTVEDLKGVDVRLAAHAPHSVSPALFEGLRRRGGPASLHLAESREESRFLLTGEGEWRDFLNRRGLHVPFRAPKTSPVRYVDSLGALRRGLVAAHCVHVDGEDRALLGERGVAVAVCPRSNRRLGVGIPPVPELRRAGVALCLGTDSLASADTLNLLDDAVALHQEFPELEPSAILRMATAGGAEALGFTDLGSISPGKRAALLFEDTRNPVPDPVEHLLSGRARPVPLRP
jgi:cytosine/adenosine deaminase-related metal-dependent hydrolase